MPTLIPWSRIKLRELYMIMNRFFTASIHRIIHFHNGGLVATSITIVGSWKDSHNGFVVLPLVSLHDELMGASNKVKAVNVSELFGYVLTESVTSATRRNTPTTAVEMKKCVCERQRIVLNIYIASSRTTWHDMTWHDMTWHDMTWHDWFSNIPIIGITPD